MVLQHRKNSIKIYGAKTKKQKPRKYSQKQKILVLTKFETTKLGWIQEDDWCYGMHTKVWLCCY